MQLLEGLKMEESMATAWLQDANSISIVSANSCCDEVYFLGQASESNRLQPSAGTTPQIEFTNSSSSTLLSESAEHYAFFDPYLQTMACKGLTVPDHTRECTEGSMPQVLEQLLTCTDAETQSQSDLNHSLISPASDGWGNIHQQVDLASTGEPLHQLPGWSEHDCIIEDWQPSSSSKSQLETPSTSIETPLNHRLWMMEIPSLYSTTLEISSGDHLFHSCNNMVTGFDDHEDQRKQLRIPFHTSNEVAAGNKKAAARKSRILLSQKSVPLQRGASHAVQAANGNGSRRALKRMYSNKLPREFLMCNPVKDRNMDPLRFLLHKVLQPSDVSNLGRIVISKKEAEAHLPYLAMKEGIFITMEDFDTAEQWTFRYRFWPNSRSRMYLLESTGEFVRAHYLKKGDVLVLWRNSLRGTFVIRGMTALPLGLASNPTLDNDGTAVDVKVEAGEDDVKGKRKASG